MLTYVFGDENVTIWFDALILISSYNKDDDNNMMWIKQRDKPIYYIIFCPYFAILTSLLFMWCVSPISVIIVILYVCSYVTLQFTIAK
jgi:hypothetical protein